MKPADEEINSDRADEHALMLAMSEKIRAEAWAIRVRASSRIIAAAGGFLAVAHLVSLR